MIAQSEDNVNTFWLCYGSYTGKKDARLFINYVQASCYASREEKQKQEAYKIYITQAVKNINQILAENFTGSYMKLTYDEMLKPQVEDTRTAEQIIEDIRNRLQRVN